MNAVRIVAVVAAVSLIVGGGVTYRVLEKVAASTGSAGVSLPGALSDLPMAIDRWNGIDAPLDDRVVDATDTDQHVSRIYRSSDREVGLFLAYGTRFRDLLPHRPEVCYPAAGWVLHQQANDMLTIADGTTLPVRIHQFRGGPVDASAVTVLSYHIVDGEIIADVSELRRRGFAARRRVGYVAQVQIRCTDGADARTARETVVAFASESAPYIKALFAPVSSRGTEEQVD